MTKTIDLQAQKTRELVNGMRANLGILASKGINVEEGELNDLEQRINTLIDKSNECDKLREEVSAKVRDINADLHDIKDKYAALKKAVKTNFMPEEWMKFGVSDKR